MSASPDREQLKRDCADALEALHRDQRVDGLPLLADAIRTLGPTFPRPWRADAGRGAGPG
jgi:hypothetical protein